MNIAEVRGLAQHMDQAASEIESTMNQVSSKLSATSWVGNDRDRFESEWKSDATRQLQQVKQLLTQASELARRNAQEQETASNG
jgi:hypothetical protein